MDSRDLKEKLIVLFIEIHFDRFIPDWFENKYIQKQTVGIKC